MDIETRRQCLIAYVELLLDTVVESGGVGSLYTDGPIRPVASC
jgi:hypothetical protein